jgi:non-ribosomal peptide synthetase component F
MLVLQNVPVPAQSFPGLTVSPSDSDTGLAKFDLLLNLAETSAGLEGFLEYSTELFEPKSIERMIAISKTSFRMPPAGPITMFRPWS